MSKLEKVALLIGIIWGLSAIADYVIPNLPFISATLAWIPYQAKWGTFGAVSLGIVILVARFVQKGRLKRLPPPIDPRFAHLAIDYSQRTDTPNKPDHARPRYVTNHTTNEAYWVPTFLESYIRGGNVNWHTHDSAEALRAYFRKNKIHPNEHGPKLEDLGLRLSRYGLPQLPDLDLARLLSKLEGKKLDDLTIILLYPWYYYYRSALSTATPCYTNKRLLLKQSTREVFWAPFRDLELIDNGLIDAQNHLRRPLESSSMGSNGSMKSCAKNMVKAAW